MIFPRAEDRHLILSQVQDELRFQNRKLIEQFCDGNKLKTLQINATIYDDSQSRSDDDGYKSSASQRSISPDQRSRQVVRGRSPMKISSISPQKQNDRASLRPLNRPQSPFHKRCQPKEGEKKFVAKPVPTKVRQAFQIASKGRAQSSSPRRSPSTTKNAGDTSKQLKGILKQSKRSTSVETKSENHDLQVQPDPNPAPHLTSSPQIINCTCFTSAAANTFQYNSAFPSGNTDHFAISRNHRIHWRENVASVVSNPRRDSSERRAMEIPSRKQQSQKGLVRKGPLSPNVLPGLQRDKNGQKISNFQVERAQLPSIPQSPGLVCELCHCESCFRRYQIQNTIAARQQPRQQRKHSNSHFNFEKPPRNPSLKIPWTDDWFQEIVEFRRKRYWDCHTETTKI